MSYKVVIADDNPLICRSLEETVNWKKWDCKVAGTAENGKKARRLIDDICPDIIITDIKMPEMDGLELTERIKEKMPETQIIMITGYQEFEYAKRAIGLGVLDLVMKPIDNQKLEEIIGKAADKLSSLQKWKESHRKLQEENKQYKNKAEISRDVLREKLVRDLILTGTVSGDLDQRMAELGMENWNYGVVLGRARASDQETVSRINRLVSQKLRQLLKDETCVELMIHHDLVFVIQAERSMSSRSYRIHMKNLLLLVKEHLLRQLGQEGRICFAVSRLTLDIHNVKGAYEQAESALRSSYFYAKDELVFSGGSPESVQTGVYSLVKDLDSFYQILETMPERTLDKEIDGLVQRIAESACGDEFKIKCLLSEICITLLRHYEMRFSDTSGYPGVDAVLGEISGLVDIEQGKQYLKKVISAIQTELKEGQKLKNPLAVRAMEYIRQNYQDNITLSSLAEHLSANASYLSRLLKKEVGNNFVDILANMRITVAKQLLDEGGRVNEVGSQVGYSDYTYFYQVFKRIEGISPSEYKKKGKKI